MTAQRGIPPIPDAGRSLLGVYGLRNPTMVWLLNRRPDLLAETPEEFQQPFATGTPPVCGWEGYVNRVNGEGGFQEGVFYVTCTQRMVFRYVHGRPAWVCMGHEGDDQSYPWQYRFLKRPPAKLNQVPAFNLWKAIRETIDGKTLDMVFDEGEWVVVRR